MLCECGSQMDSLGRIREYTVYRCSECDSIRIPNHVDHEAFYREYNDYIARQGFVDYRGRFRHDLGVAANRLSTMKDYTPIQDASFLDVGAGNGAMVMLLRAKGAYSLGVDLCPDNKSPMVRIGDFLKLTFDRKFDTIMFFDSLEHFTSPQEPLSKAVSLWSGVGVIVIEGPDPSSHEAKLAGILWKHLKPIEHPFIPSQKLLDSIMQTHGLKPKFAKNIAPVVGRKMIIYG